MSDDTTGDVFGTTDGEGESGGAIEDLGKAVGGALGGALGEGGAEQSVQDMIKQLGTQHLDGGDGGGHGHVWDEEIPNEFPGLNPTGTVPTTLTPEQAAQQNAEQEAGRQKAIEDGVDPQTAQIMYPDIDPNDPYRIN